MMWTGLQILKGNDDDESVRLGYFQAFFLFKTILPLYMFIKEHLQNKAETN